MYQTNGVGLAAPQVGINQRFFVADWSQYMEGRNVDEKSALVIINPIIIGKSGEMIDSEEKCLSVPGPSAVIKRHDSVLIHAYDLNFKMIKLQLNGLAAIVAQHEIDHLNGKLYFDHLSRLKRDIFVRKLRKIIKKDEEWRYLGYGL